MKNDMSELFSDIFKEAGKIKASAAEMYALYERRIDILAEENARFRKALEKIKDMAELEESTASNATYGFAYEIEELARSVLDDK